MSDKGKGEVKETSFIEELKEVSMQINKDWPDWKKDITLLEKVNITETIIVTKTNSKTEDTE
ncbi:MAG: hypothetical protein IID03_09690 [Candidatus Dadabacteria bacterium]|nr:hypothetical protein [Candidatus Dadabacteria bacterium]